MVKKKNTHRNKAYIGRRFLFKLHSGKVGMQKFCLARGAILCSCKEEGGPCILFLMMARMRTENWAVGRAGGGTAVGR